MLFLKYLLIAAGAGMLVGAAALILYDVFLATELHRLLGGRKEGEEPSPRRPAHPVRWQTAGKLAGLAWLPLLLGLSIIVVPSGMAGVRVSQLTGTRAGTLHPGMHFVIPLVEQVALYDVRDRVYVTVVAEDGARPEPRKKVELLAVQS
jgi:hypothetical protein